MKYFFSMIMIVIIMWSSSVCALTELTESNAQGSPGSQYWDILAPGSYILNPTANDFITNHNYAVRIFASDVIFDGNAKNGKTITGPSIGTVESGPSYYGVRVNSGDPNQPSVNVTVHHVTVTKKFSGVKYEYVQGGEIRDSVFSSNDTGIYALKSLNLKILSNTVNSNSSGIVLGSENDSFTIDSNIVKDNVQFGILLWWSNNHNVINNNQVNNNNIGIALTDGGAGASGSGTDNTISNNTVNGNVNGIFLSNYHGNRITGNSLSGNTNVSVLLSASSSGNQFTGNYVQESGWLGIYLTSEANGNVFYNNLFKNGAVFQDSNYGSDGTVSNNQWNITPVAGVNNIVGGPSIGGNYWSNPSSTGFSSTHRDGNFDGFCDQPYNPQSDLIDNYPLHNPTENINTLKYLNNTNALGSPGHQYWDILNTGTYVLTDSINTDNNYAVRIYASDVIFDGNGKTITGPSIGTVESGPSYYGIRVNSGSSIQNVTVKNVTVTKKYIGVIYEYVQGGEIRDSHFTSNHAGIYTWKSLNLNIMSNTVNSNNDGIVLDANQSTNDYFTIDSNNVSDNVNNGIMLWFSNNHNTITNNQVNRNYMGIALTDGGSGAVGTDNTISGNTVNGNVNGIFVSNYNDNHINDNSLSGNSNAAVYLEFSSNRNIITNNQVNDNPGMGIALTDERTDGIGGTDNTLSDNTINRNANGIFVRNYHNNSITGNSLSDNANIGVWLLQSSSGNRFTGNYVLSSEMTGWWGMYLTESAHGNIFYNNVFKNSHGLINTDENYGSDETVTVDSNQWYTTPTPGVNIVGGPTIGGNYWGNASSTGFSDTHPDSNNDGFCDQPYHPYHSTNPHSELIDQYPLHKVAVFNVTPASLNFGSVPVGSTKDQFLTVKNTGSGTLSGNATTAAPFSVVSGGSYSLGPDQSQVVTIRYQPTSAGSHSGEVLFTGGGGATVPVTGKTEGPRGLPWLILLLGN